MSEKIVTLRHDQICDVCKHPIRAGEKAYMTRDDFWPSMVWFEHVGGCPNGIAVVTGQPKKPAPAPAAAAAHAYA